MSSPRMETLSRAAMGMTLLTMNRRGHWSKDDALRKEWKEWARSMGAVVRARGGSMKAPVKITVSIMWPDNRRRDIGNYAQTAKAIVDGLVQSGLIEDDRDTMVIGPDVRRVWDSHSHLTRVWVRIEEVSNEPTDSNESPNTESRTA